MGFHSSKWQPIQQCFYSAIGSPHSDKQWASILICKLWDIAWDMWQHKHCIVHKPAELYIGVMQALDNIIEYATKHTKDHQTAQSSTVDIFATQQSRPYSDKTIQAKTNWIQLTQDLQTQTNMTTTQGSLQQQCQRCMYFSILQTPTGIQWPRFLTQLYPPSQSNAVSVIVHSTDESSLWMTLNHKCGNDYICYGQQKIIHLISELHTVDKMSCSCQCAVFALIWIHHRVQPQPMSPWIHMVLPKVMHLMHIVWVCSWRALISWSIIQLLHHCSVVLCPMLSWHFRRDMWASLHTFVPLSKCSSNHGSQLCIVGCCAMFNVQLTLWVWHMNESSHTCSIVAMQPRPIAVAAKCCHSVLEHISRTLGHPWAYHYPVPPLVV